MNENDIRAISYERMYRKGRPSSIPARCRDIVIKFSQQGCKAVLMQHIKNLQKGTSCFVSDQYPPEINERRRQMQKVCKEKKAEGKHVKLVADCLLVDGKIHSLDPPKKPHNPDIFVKDKAVTIKSADKFSEMASHTKVTVSPLMIALTQK